MPPAGSTFPGAQIDTYDVASGFVGNVFTNSATTLFVGVSAEIASVGALQSIYAVEKAVKSSQSSSSRAHYSTQKAVPARTFTY